MLETNIKGACFNKSYFACIIFLSVDRRLCDDTLVSSLCEMDVDIIGEMAIKLDLQQKGKQNWRDLAGELGVPRKDFLSFGTDPENRPTEKLFDYLISVTPRLTLGELKEHLRIPLMRPDVVSAIESSCKGWYIYLHCILKVKSLKYVKISFIGSQGG